MPDCVGSGWWLVENESKRMAWFPAPYLEKVEEDEDEDEDELDWIPERGIHTATVLQLKFLLLHFCTLVNVNKYKALHNYQSYVCHPQECCTLQSRPTTPPKMMR